LILGQILDLLLNIRNPRNTGVPGCSGKEGKVGIGNQAQDF